MPIELLCPGCSQQLRVPDTAAGKNAKCPKCNSIIRVPSADAPAPLQPLQNATPAPAPTQPSLQPLEPLGGGGGLDFGSPPSSGGSFGSPPPKNPFADQASGAAAGGGWQSGPLNPYASPSNVSHDPKPAGPVGHQYVEIGPILNHAVNVWQNNLGVLVGSTLIAVILVIVLALLGRGVVMAVLVMREPLLASLVSLVVELGNSAWQTFLGIGQALIALNLARGRNAEIGDLFKGASLFPSIFGYVMLINGPVIVAGFVSGALGQELILIGFIVLWYVVLIAAMFFIWPTYYLIVDERAKLFPAFGIAARLTEGNRLTSFLMWIIGFGILVLGVMALCVGALFAVPLVSVLYASAYLMMSGQIPVTPVAGSQQPQEPYRQQRFQ